MKASSGLSPTRAAKEKAAEEAAERYRREQAVQLQETRAKIDRLRAARLEAEAQRVPPAPAAKPKRKARAG